jgi:ArsR family transcriptional regulator
MLGIFISMAGETTFLIFKALADPTRLHIVEFLAKCAWGQINLLDESGAVEGPTAGEVCCHITGADKITSTVSHHLHELENAGLVKLEKRGKTTVCTLVPSALNDVSHYLTKLASGENQTGCC